MPTYEYECTNGHEFEVEQRITEEPLKRCKICRAKATRLISATNFILKGSGWFSDGYGNKGKSSSSETKSESKSDSSSSTSSTDKKSSSGGSSDSKSGASSGSSAGK